MKSKLFLLAVLLMAIGLMSGCTTVQTEETGTITISLIIQDGSEINAKELHINSELNAFEILEANTTSLEFVEFSFGKMITGINGRKVNESKEYWAVYVNKEYAMQGLEQTFLTEGDELLLKIEQIE